MKNLKQYEISKSSQKNINGGENVWSCSRTRADGSTYYFTTENTNLAASFVRTWGSLGSDADCILNWEMSDGQNI